jgi:hypothetical protein
MFNIFQIIVLIQTLLIFKLSALPFEGTICAHKGKIHTIIIGGIRAPGHWLYPSVDKVYGANDKHVLIINDLSMTNPDVQAMVNNAALPVLEKTLSCLKGSVHEIVFEHVGYGLQEKNFHYVMMFLTSLLKPGGKIVYTSYRVPFSRVDSQLRQRHEYLPFVPSLCQLIGVPEPKIIYEFLPHQMTIKGYQLENELNALNHNVRQKIQTLLNDDSCTDVENNPEIQESMRRVKIILDHPCFPKPIKLWAPIESYSPLHSKIINCKSDLPHGFSSCSIIKEWWPYHTKRSPCSQTLKLFEDAGLIVRSIEAEHTDDVFAFKIIVEKHNSQDPSPKDEIRVRYKSDSFQSHLYNQNFS